VLWCTGCSISSDPTLAQTAQARIVEQTMRSCNNLLEKFHQSFFLYLMVSPSHFVPIEVYMLALGLVAIGLPTTAASLVMNGARHAWVPN
jgi:glycosylphosphatidylinositol transamidase